MTSLPNCWLTNLGDKEQLKGRWRDQNWGRFYDTSKNGGAGFFLFHRIHGTCIYTYMNGWFFMVNVGEYTSPMDPMGMWFSPIFVQQNYSKLEAIRISLLEQMHALLKRWSGLPGKHHYSWNLDMYHTHVAFLQHHVCADSCYWSMYLHLFVACSSIRWFTWTYQWMMEVDQCSNNEGPTC